jgi:ubiquitin carboxyl-terminal hydrolase 22/27/51
MDELFQEFYSSQSTESYAAYKVLSDCWLSQQAAFSELAGYDEHDAHEFFQFLAEELHRTSTKPRSQSSSETGEGSVDHATAACSCIIHQTFYGKLQSTLTCESCDGVTTSTQPFLDLSLAIDTIAQRRESKAGIDSSKRLEPLTLQRCLDEEYMQSERCEYSCRVCNSPQNALKQLSIKTLPNVLCIQFKVSGPKITALMMLMLDTAIRTPPRFADKCEDSLEG